jgi:WD40 repeat protein
MNADGSGRIQLTTDPASDRNPSWSPDGTRIVFQSNRDGNSELYVMNADGSNQVQITNDPETDRDPSWSPDGKRIAFASSREHFVCDSHPSCVPRATSRIFTMKTDGSDVTRISVTRLGNSDHSAEDHYHPDWSPSGDQVVYQSAEDDFTEEFYADRIFIVGSNGSGNHLFTLIYGGTYPDSGVAWSPDGQSLVQAYDYALYTLALTPNGQNRNFSGCCDFLANWQPLPSSQPGGYPRPKGATPIHASLVPAYNPCTSPNEQHGPPLSFGSCSPPVPASPNLTVGGNGGGGPPARSTGYFRIDTIAGSPGPPDTADAVVTVSLSNVMNTAGLTDYTGTLSATAAIRMTDRDSGTPATIQDFPLAVSVPCAATADTTLGAACNVQTTFDSVVPGLATEGQRANLGLGQVRVLDGSGSLFAVQGVFVP